MIRRLVSLIAMALVIVTLSAKPTQAQVYVRAGYGYYAPGYRPYCRPYYHHYYRPYFRPAPGVYGYGYYPRPRYYGYGYVRPRARLYRNY